MDEYYKYQEIMDKVQIIEKKIDLIILHLNGLNKDTKKMSDHIDFIDKTYDKMSAPLMWVCDKVNNIRGVKNGPENHAITDTYTRQRSTIDDQD